jgi:V8-like Glu-specific endopeptidase
MQMPSMVGAPELDAAAAVEMEAAGPAGFSPSGAAAANGAAVAKKGYAQDWAIANKAAASTDGLAIEELAGTSTVFDSFYLNFATPFWNVYPHKWVGRLSFNVPGGTSFCSATSISGNVMLTAAHCVFDTSLNRWYSGWVFAPAYRNGATPFGTFPAQSCTILSSWANLSGSFTINGWTKYDVAVCKMGTNSLGQTLNSAVGYMGRKWDAPNVRHVFNLGYPWRDYRNITMPNAGLYLRGCAAETFTQTTNTLGSGCSYGPGISGGPWMTGYQPGIVSGWAGSVNSGFYVNTPNLYGIRFTSTNIVPLCTAAGC